MPQTLENDRHGLPISSGKVIEVGGRIRPRHRAVMEAACVLITDRDKILDGRVPRDRNAHPSSRVRGAIELRVS